MSKTPLVVEGVGKRFGSVEALTDLTLKVAPGERVALLGHNGAGKTTLMRLVLGFIKPDAGSVRVAGGAPGSKEARHAIAYVPESVSFPKVLSGREIMGLYATLKGATRAQADAALEQVGLDHAADRRVGTYSKGMRQRLGLAQALVGAPGLLLLDEPTSGLDPVSRGEFYGLINTVSEAGAAVLLSSHSLDEIQARTDRVAILRQGELVADATLATLQQEAAIPIRIRVRAKTDTVAEVQERLGGTRVNGQSVELFCPADEKMDRLSMIAELGKSVTDIDVHQPSLDEIYRHFSRNEETQ